MVFKMFNNSSNLSVTVPFKKLPWEAINLHRCSYSWMNTENSSSEMFPPRAVCPLLCKIFALLKVSWVSENTVPRGCLVSALARSCGSQGVSVCILRKSYVVSKSEKRANRMWIQISMGHTHIKYYVCISRKNFHPPVTFYLTL